MTAESRQLERASEWMIIHVSLQDWLSTQILHEGLIPESKRSALDALQIITRKSGFVPGDLA